YQQNNNIVSGECYHLSSVILNSIPLINTSTRKSSPDQGNFYSDFEEKRPRSESDAQQYTIYYLPARINCVYCRWNEIFNIQTISDSRVSNSNLWLHMYLDCTSDSA